MSGKMANGQRRFVTVDDIAKELEVPRPTVYQWIRMKKLAAYKFGKYVKVTPAALEDYIRRSHKGVETEESSTKTDYGRMRQVRKELDAFFFKIRRR